MVPAYAIGIVDYLQRYSPRRTSRIRTPSVEEQKDIPRRQTAMVALGQNQHDDRSRVQNLVHGLLDDHDEEHCSGSMSCSVYDSAWVACVSRVVAGRTQWLFPSTFKYVLLAQSPSGRFPAHMNDPEGASVNSGDILATLAALYMLKRFNANPYQLKSECRDLPQRICLATDWLSTSLPRWTLDHTIGVGFELLVPALLDLLERDGISFTFPSRAQLWHLRHEKLSKFTADMLYKQRATPILHSLEAFYGDENIDFDKIRHHKVHGSMMASPSATAAFIMRQSSWDEEAEAYLRLVVSKGSGKCQGGVPSAYPSTNFEILWVCYSRRSLKLI